MIFAALALPVALGVAALAVEGGLWYADHHQMRNMADAAALSAGWARREGANEFDASMATVPDIGFNAATDEIEVISPPASGPYAGDANAIEVIARRTRPTTLSAVFSSQDEISIEARATVRLQSLGSYCILALHQTAPEALRMVGTAYLNLVNCGVNVNSNAANALSMVGVTRIYSTWAEVTGGITTDGNAEIHSTTPPETGVLPRPDPYADLPMPSTGTCNHNAVEVHNATIALSPGRYCGGVTFNSKAKVTMSPGTYYIDGSSLTINGGATVTGSGVTIILTGSDSNYATATINGGAKVTLTAPTSGTYKGLALVQDRNAPLGAETKLNGGSTMAISGALYFPTQSIEFAGGNSTGMGCTRLIANTIKLSGNATLANNCGGFGLPETAADDPQLVG